MKVAIKVHIAFPEGVGKNTLVYSLYGDPYEIPRKLKCGPCQVGDHQSCEGDECYCDCEKNRSPE